MNGFLVMVILANLVILDIQLAVILNNVTKTLLNVPLGYRRMENNVPVVKFLINQVLIRVNVIKSLKIVLHGYLEMEINAKLVIQIIK